jgi:hypothetical protein
MGQVVVSEDWDLLGRFLWRGSAAIFVAYDAVTSREANAVHGMASFDV